MEILTKEQKLIQKLSQNPFSTLEKAIYEILLEDIITLRYEPESPFLETHLAKEFGVSRSPVRQAIQLLEEQGFVQKKENTKTIVAPQNEKEYSDMIQFRYIIEPAASGYASLLMTNEDFARMKEYADILHQSFYDKDYLQILKYEQLFHSMIVECSQNQYLMKAYNGIQPYLTRSRAVYILSHLDVDPVIYSEEHYLIYNSLKLRNREIAESISRHLLLTFFPLTPEAGHRNLEKTEYGTYKDILKQQNDFFLNLTEKR